VPDASSRNAAGEKVIALAFPVALALGAAGLATLGLIAGRALDAEPTGPRELRIRRVALPAAEPFLLPAHEEEA
jgi:hypothetical protein